jgi:hypothetical protein
VVDVAYRVGPHEVPEKKLLFLGMGGDDARIGPCIPADQNVHFVLIWDFPLECVLSVLLVD